MYLYDYEALFEVLQDESLSKLGNIFSRWIKHGRQLRDGVKAQVLEGNRTLYQNGDTSGFLAI